MLVALTGLLDGSPSTFSEAKITSLEDVCVDENIITPSARNECLVGSWELDLQDLRSQIEANVMAAGSGNDEFNLGAITGQVNLNLSEDGTGSGFSNVTIVGGDNGGLVLTTNVTGGADFDWSTQGNRYLVSNQTGLSLTFTSEAIFQGISIPIDQNEEFFSPEDLFGSTGSNGSRFACGGSVLTIFGEGEFAIDARYIKN